MSSKVTLKLWTMESFAGNLSYFIRFPTAMRVGHIITIWILQRGSNYKTKPLKTLSSRTVRPCILMWTFPNVRSATNKQTFKMAHQKAHLRSLLFWLAIEAKSADHATASATKIIPFARWQPKQNLMENVQHCTLPLG